MHEDRNQGIRKQIWGGMGLCIFFYISFLDEAQPGSALFPDLSVTHPSACWLPSATLSHASLLNLLSSCIINNIQSVEGLYCKRKIQCLASSKILTPTPTPLTARRVRTPPPLVRGEDTLAGWRGGWGVNSSEDARHCSVLCICKYYVLQSILSP